MGSSVNQDASPAPNLQIRQGYSQDINLRRGFFYRTCSHNRIKAIVLVIVSYR